VFAVMLLAFVAKAQERITFNPTWTSGQKDSFRLAMTMGTDRGDVSLSMRLDRSVARVFDNGDAEVQSSVDELKVAFNGQEIEGSQLASQLGSSERLNRFGMPVGAKAKANRGVSIDYARYLTMFTDKGLRVGETVPVEYTDPENAKSTIRGTCTLEAIESGIARLVGKYEIANENATTPMKAAITTWVRVSDSKIAKSAGTISNVTSPQGVSIDAIQLSMERIEPKDALMSAFERQR
jgi:hypothetical protein